ncbi:MAG: RHS domain-containing protein [Nitrospirae bacterium]|nr:RHS domain-containing protein [Nitrospirota bacterium]
MKSFKYFCLLAGIFLSAIGFFYTPPAHAGTFTAVLGSDGVVNLSGSETFECTPGYPYTFGSMASIYFDGFYTPIATVTSSTNVVSFDNITYNLSCKNPGNYVFSVSLAGGKRGNYGICIMSQYPGMTATVNLPVGREIKIESPGEYAYGVENIVVPYNFTYSTDTCYDGSVNRCNRSVSIIVGTQYLFLQSGLPISGQIIVPYNFGNSGQRTIQASASCGGYSNNATKTVSVTPCYDNDLDGYSNCNDCNDNDAAIHPAATEVCDGKDNNCNGYVDEGFDVDGDGFTTCGGDCNDNDTLINPAAQELCDGIDNNCDGLVDDTCNGGSDSKCPERSNSTEIGSSASLASGNLFHSQQVLGSQRTGLTASITLSYNSLDTTIGALGKGWTNNYNTSITDNGNILVLKEGDGRRVYFHSSGINTYSPESSSGSHSIITKNPDGSYTLTEKTGIKYDYNSNGNLIRITDRNNNTLTFAYTGSDLTLITDSSGRTTTLTYDSNHRIISIIDTAGRIITFTYNSNFLNTVTDPLGATWSYTYDTNGRMLTKTDPLGHTTTYTYDADGRITSSQDPNGNIKTILYNQTGKTAYVTEKNGTQWTYAYDNSLNVPLQTTDPSGNQATYQYDSNRNLISKTEPDGRITSYTYDTNGNVLSQTDALGNTTSYTYNGFGQTLTKTDADGNTTTYVYDAGGNLIQEIDAQGNITSHTYGSHGERLSTIDPNGNLTTYTYNQYGDPASVTNVLNQTTTYSYDIMGNLISAVDANGAATTYEYDLVDRLTKESRPDGGVINYEYDLAGSRTAIVDANSNRTIFTYDNQNRLIKTTDPEGNSINYTYDLEGNMTSMTIKDNTNNIITTETYTYDIYNRLLKTTHTDGTFTEQSYDIHGNILTKKDENVNITTFSYDALNRLLSVTDPNEKVTSYTYDKRNNLKTVTDANGNTTTYTYDSLNRLISTISPDTGTVTYSYDPNGNLVAKTDANSVTIIYTYDALNRQTSIQFPDSTQNINYYYDDVQLQNSKGRLTTMTDSSGITWYDYDKMGRVIKETKQIDNVVYGTEYIYDLNGNPLTITYPGGRVVTYTYNQLNKITSVTDTFSGVTKTLANNITYLPFGDVTSITQGNGIITAKTYDNRNRLNSLNIGTLKQLSYTRDNTGNITAVTDNLDATKNKAFVYDNFYRLTQATGSWGSLNYSYDGAGNRQTETTATGLTNYLYNANRLVSGIGEKTFNFTYDNNGNTISDNSRQYIYNQNQRLTQVTDTGAVLGEYIYNGNGQRVKKTIDGQTTIFHYDLQGMLIAESTNTGTITNEYVYLNGEPLAKIGSTVSGNGYNYPDPVNAPGFRASLSLNVKASFLGTSWLKYYYTYNRLNFTSTSITGLTIAGDTTTVTGVGTVNGSPNYTFTATITDSSLGNQPSQPDAMGIEIKKPDGTLYYSALSQPAASGNYSIEGSNIYYYHNDHLSTPMLMTSSSGSVVWQGEFKPFGEPLSVSGSVTNNIRFPGQYYDSETGLHQNYFRDYKPEVGRYIESDPILQPTTNLKLTSSGCSKTKLKWQVPDLLSNPKDLHPYFYTANNPVNSIDPQGLLTIPGTNWCGPGGGGPTTGCFDNACKRHDKCYEDCGIDALSRWVPGNILGGCAKACDKTLMKDWKKCACDRGASGSW